MADLTLKIVPSDLSIVDLASAGTAKFSCDLNYGMLVPGNLRQFAKPVAAVLERHGNERADVVHGYHLQTALRPKRESKRSVVDALYLAKPVLHEKNGAQDGIGQASPANVFFDATLRLKRRDPVP